MMGFGNKPRHRCRACVLNEKCQAPERMPDFFGLSLKLHRPLRIVVDHWDASGQWLQLTDCVCSYLLFGKRLALLIRTFSHWMAPG